MEVFFLLSCNILKSGLYLFLLIIGSILIFGEKCKSINNYNLASFAKNLFQAYYARIIPIQNTSIRRSFFQIAKIILLHFSFKRKSRKIEKKTYFTEKCHLTEK